MVNHILLTLPVPLLSLSIPFSLLCFSHLEMCHAICQEVCRARTAWEDDELVLAVLEGGELVIFW